MFTPHTVECKQGWELAHSLIHSNRSGQMSKCEQFAQVAQDKWVNVSNSLRSLRTNEQLWVNRSDRSGQMNNCERIAQVTHDSWANVSDSHRSLSTKCKHNLFPGLKATTSSFFHDSNQSGPLINRLKYFRNRFRFCRDIRIFKKLCFVHPTSESDSAVCNIPGSQAPQCAYSAMCITPRNEVMNSSSKTPRSQTPRCASHCGVKCFSSVCFNPKVLQMLFLCDAWRY